VGGGEAGGDKTCDDNNGEEFEGEIFVFHGGWFLFTGAETPPWWGAVARAGRISAMKFFAPS
jgi:hypothetical protein